MTQNLKVGVSANFFDAFAKLPKGIQGKTSRLMTKFRNNPRSPGLNYETIRNAHPHMRSIRIDQAYRAIVLHPKEGNVYLLLWVDHHDPAYQWAQRHKCQINPMSGAIQVFEVQEKTVEVKVPVYVPEEKPAPAEPVHYPFAEFHRDDLLRIGVPSDHIENVRKIRHESDLDGYRGLPKDAYECLFLLLCDTPYDQLLTERGLKYQEAIDTEDFEAALNRPVTQNSIVVLDDKELEMMLSSPLSKWRVYLHPTQQRYAYGHKNGSARVLGGAGTGKTVVAMHRAKWLAENVASSERKVLFTTFTKNLARDIKENLRSICNEEQMERIEVRHLDSWVWTYLRRLGYESEILNDETKRREMWQMALLEKTNDLPDAFYIEEWERVIQANDIQRLEDYKRISRQGRGTRLNRRERIQAWRVFDEYRIQLMRNRLKEFQDTYRDAIMRLKSDDPPYAAIVVDEAQDMGTQAFRLLRAIVPEGANDLFIVGDAHQRIYGRNRVVLGQCDINIRGRAAKLKLNYRTTDEIRKEAVRLLEGRSIDDLDGGQDDNKGYRSLFHGPQPTFHQHEDGHAQNTHIAKELQELAKDPDSNLQQICIVARTKRELDSFKNALQDHHLDYVTLDGHTELQSKPGVRLATVHRVKGLEFESVILISANANLVPLQMALDKADQVAHEEADTEERGLIYVALTRARKTVSVHSYGEGSSYFDWEDKS